MVEGARTVSIRTAQSVPSTTIRRPVAKRLPLTYRSIGSSADRLSSTTAPEGSPTTCADGICARPSSAHTRTGIPASEGGIGTATTAAAAGANDRALSLAGIPVRVCAELGRARMPTAEVVGLPPGAVVELNRQADEPIDLYVNGRRFATGRLMVVDGADWAVRIETILGQPESNMDKEVA